VDRRTVGEEIVLVAPSWTEAAERDLRELARDMELPEMEYKVRVVNTPLCNAYATDHGFVYVTTGLLDTIQDRGEWTAVLGRELYHIHHKSHMNCVNTIRRERTSEAVVTTVAVLLVIGVVVLLVCAAESDDVPPPRQARGQPSSRLPKRPGSGAGYPRAHRSDYVPLSLLLLPAVAAASAEPPPPYHPAPTGPRADWGDIPRLVGYSSPRELAADRFSLDLLRLRGYDPMALPRLLRRIRNKCQKKGRAVWNYPSGLVKAKPGIGRRIREAETYLQNEVNP